MQIIHCRPIIFLLLAAVRCSLQAPRALLCSAAALLLFSACLSVALELSLGVSHPSLLLLALRSLSSDNIRRLRLHLARCERPLQPAQQLRQLQIHPPVAALIPAATALARTSAVAPLQRVSSLLSSRSPLRASVAPAVATARLMSSSSSGSGAGAARAPAAAAASSPAESASSSSAPLKKLEELQFDNLALRALPIDPERRNFTRQVRGERTRRMSRATPS